MRLPTNGSQQQPVTEGRIWRKNQQDMQIGEKSRTTISVGFYSKNTENGVFE